METNNSYLHRKIFEFFLSDIGQSLRVVLGELGSSESMAIEEIKRNGELQNFLIYGEYDHVAQRITELFQQETPIQVLTPELIGKFIERYIMDNMIKSIVQQYYNNKYFG